MADGQQFNFLSDYRKIFTLPTRQKNDELTNFTFELAEKINLINSP